MHENEVVRFENVTKEFGKTKALSGINCAIGRGQLVGLVGGNGSGKTTFLRHVLGLYLPTSGRCLTFGVSNERLGRDELSRIGAVHQHGEYLTWMNVRELISYVSSFHKLWDTGMERRLLDIFELDSRALVSKLSPGNRQRLGVLLATCHHPELLLLDEPLSDLDPLARTDVLQLLLDLCREDGPTIIVSSHILTDIERIIDHVICMDIGRITIDEPLDQLLERFAEWIVTPTHGSLPDSFGESWIASQSGDADRRVLIVTDGPRQLERFRAEHDVNVEQRAMNLDRIFPYIVRGSARRAREAQEAVGVLKR